MGRPKEYGDTALTSADRQSLLRSKEDRKRVDGYLSSEAYTVVQSYAQDKGLKSISSALESLVWESEPGKNFLQKMNRTHSEVSLEEIQKYTDSIPDMNPYIPDGNLGCSLNSNQPLAMSFSANACSLSSSLVGSNQNSLVSKSSIGSSTSLHQNTNNDTVSVSSSSTHTHLDETLTNNENTSGAFQSSRSSPFKSNTNILLERTTSTNSAESFFAKRSKEISLKKGD